MNLRLRLTLSILIALVLSILPLPTFLLNFRPPWLLLIFLYIHFYKTEYLYLPLVFFLGLVLDVVLATPLGEHSVALLIVLWLAGFRQRRFNRSPMRQQFLLISVLCFTYQALIFCMDGIFGFSPQWLTLVLGTGTAILCWPWLRLLAEDIYP